MLEPTSETGARMHPDSPKDHSFRARLEEICGEDPTGVWLTLYRDEGETQVTRRELIERVADYCHHYSRGGVKPGDTVLIILKESLDLFASFFAGIAYGALPAFFAYPSPKQTARDFQRSIDNLVEQNRIRLVVGFREVIDELRQRSANGGEERTSHVDCEEVERRGQATLAHWPWPRREMFLQFSSGTTGAKKGVKISAEALMNQIGAYAPRVAFDADSRVISWLPHYHDMGLIACMLMPFLRRVPIVMMSPFDWVRRPVMLLEGVSRHRATHLWLPNFALGHLAKSVHDEEVKRLDLSSIRQLIGCSEPVLRETVQRFQSKFAPAGFDPSALRCCYAMAENTFAMTSTSQGPLEFLEIDRRTLQGENRVAPRAGGKPVASVGEPLANMQIRILAENGEPAAADAVGEIAIRSDCMLSGYHNNPQATREAMADGWFKTGDLGFLHKGELFITGRRKNVIIVGGENIYPQDIQLILNDEPYLIPGRSAVFGVEDDRIGTERIVVLAEAREGRTGEDTTLLTKKIFHALNISVSTIALLPHRTLRKGTAGKISNYLNKQDYLNGEFDEFLRGPDKPKSTPAVSVFNDLAAPLNAAPLNAASVARAIQCALPADSMTTIREQTPLLSSGLIDSFAFTDLVRQLEGHFRVRIDSSFWTPDHFDTAARIERMIGEIRGGAQMARRDTASESFVAQRRAESLARLKQPQSSRAAPGGFWEWAINHCPLRVGAVYRFLLRRAGVRVGRNVTFLGRLHVKIRGRAENIEIGDNVVLGDGVDLRNREDGRIILHERSYLDQNVRLVAARAGRVELKFGAEIGANTVVNSGGITEIGQFAMIASNVNINSSRHGVDRDAFVKEQAHQHGAIKIGDDVWIGAGASILLNTTLGEGAVVSSNSVVSGDIPAMAICAGVPARVIQFRAASPNWVQRAA